MTGANDGDGGGEDSNGAKDAKDGGGENSNGAKDANDIKDGGGGGEE